MTLKNKKGSKLLAIAICCFFYFQSHAQKIGVVLSGGGANGIAHIGVLKALEENNIPIDYITGTSQGALIASLYAMGYSPAQIEGLVNMPVFKDMLEGIVDDKYAYYFKRSDNDASWVSFKLSVDSVISAKLPTNVLSPISMDFALMEFLGAPATKINNFDSLFIPFRCVASDIEKKESVVFRNGNLAEAVRASVAYPFYIPPIRVDGKLLFDGGLYNNFPSNVMYNDFFPDFIIGSNVSSNTTADEDDLFSQVKSMLQSKSNYDILCEGGVFIEPKTNVGLFDYSRPQPVIDSGYAAAMRHVKHILELTECRSTPQELNAKRMAFNNKKAKLPYDNIYITGLNKKQTDYATKILRHKKELVDINEIKEGYFRLASDNKIKSIYPKTVFNPKTGYNDLYLNVKKERDLITYFGGNFSNRPISQGYFAMQYNYLGRFASEMSANAYFGKLYSSVQLKNRLDFPFRLPIYIEPCITWQTWDYYKSSNAFLEDVKPAYLKQHEEYANLNIGFPTGKKGRFITGAGVAQTTDRYYQINSFSVQDTADRTDFRVFTSHATYQINSLNRKQYASQGECVNINVRYVLGEETNTPGSTSTDTVNKYTKNHEWLVIRAKAERYFNRRGTFRFGISGEGVFSAQTLFNNYTSSVLAAPAFQPTPDSKTIFLENYRAHKFIAGGVKFIVNLYKSVEFRLEMHAFQPINTLVKTPDLKTTYGKTLALQHYVGTSALVWHTPVGPMCLSVNYYDQEKNPLSILFHFGYIIFNKRALE